MKLFIVGDVHWCQYSSIVRSRGEKYSKRLENLIETVNYAEKQAEDRNCDYSVYLGDFFDRSDLNAEELSALSDVRWGNTRKVFIKGNHEISSEFCSCSILKLLGKVITEPTTLVEPFNDTPVHFLPYISEDKRRSIVEYLQETKCPKIPVILSHNDIKGVQMGGFISKQGFEVDDILNSSSIFINGHLHNGDWIVRDRILNLGNATGQNFGENAEKYSHRFLVLGTETLSMEFVENPYALNFYKFDMRGLTNHEISDTLNRVNHNSSIFVQITDKQNPENVQTMVNRFLASRILVETEKLESKEIDKISVDHLKDFNDFILSECSDVPYIREELQEVVR